jgi:translation elongation factor EF-G
LWSFGPKWHGSNVLLLPISDLAAVSTYSVSAQLNNQSLAAVEVDHDADQHDLEADSSPESSQPAKPASVHALPATAELVNLDEATQRRALFRSIESSIVSGFQLATAGPLCEEPMRGVAFRLESINVHSVDILNSDPYGPLSGQVMAAVKDVCRKAYTAAAPRLMEPVYV